MRREGGIGGEKVELEERRWNMRREGRIGGEKVD